MNFTYAAYDRAGTLASGELEAPDDRHAREQLRQRGLYVTELRAAGAPGVGASGSTTGRAHPGKGRGHTKELTAFARQLEVLVASGTPLVDSLAAIERQAPEGRWRSIVSGLRRRVEEGKPLSEAMASHPRAFNGICRSLVAAGEASGRLGEMLNRLSLLVRQQQHIRKSVVGTLMYPALLISVSIGVLVMMVIFVLPRFGGMFETLNADLPATTRALMWLSGTLKAWWWAVLLGLGGTSLGLIAWLRTPGGQARLDSLVVRVPIVGPILRSFLTARLARLLGVLLESRLPMLEAIELTRTAAGNAEYRRLLDKAEDLVTRGEPISAAFEGSPLVSGSVTEAIRNAERSGAVGSVLTSVADYLDEDNQVLIRSLTSLLEPIVLLIIGAVIATVAISMFMPMFDLVASAPGAAS